jgi:hypothetical protein
LVLRNDAFHLECCGASKSTRRGVTNRVPPTIASAGAGRPACAGRLISSDPLGIQINATIVFCP